MAAAVLALGITTAITTLQRGLRSIDTARHTTYASQVMQSEMERLRLKSWAQIQALQDSSDSIVPAPGLAGVAAASFACTRTIQDLRADMKEITLVATWRGIDGQAHSVRTMTRYGKSGLYDYFYTSH